MLLIYALIQCKFMIFIYSINAIKLLFANYISNMNLNTIPGLNH